jgi:hypothetical protein
MPTPTAFGKQPEPWQPLVQGEITGLPDNVLATIYVHLPSGQLTQWGHRRNGPWESVVTASGGAQKIITAEAEGYVSDPISYTVYSSDTVAYVVEGGQITDEEALHLDFHFEPVAPP